jgi:hypothetical protein
METDANKLLRVQEAVRQMIANNESPDYIDNFLAQQGESADSLRAINQFGAEKVANARKSTQEYEKGATARYIKNLPSALAAGERAFSDVVISMGEEALKDASAGLYGNLLGKEGYERRKAELKSQAQEGGYRLPETIARGLSGATGMFASPIFKVGGLVTSSPLAQALMGPAAYSAIKKATEGGSAKDIAKAGAGGAIAGGVGYGIGKGLEKILTSGAGATSGLGSDVAYDVKDAGARGSKAFKAGKKMSDAEFARTMNKRVGDIRETASEQFVKGKNAIGNKVVDKAGLLNDYQNSYAEHVSSGGLVNEEANRVYKAAEKLIRKFDRIKNPTVSDVDMLKRNINDIVADSRTAIQARTELANITKDAADIATGGQYSKVMEPFTETMNALVDMGKISKDVPDWSAQTAGILRRAKTEFGKETIKNVLGSDVYDMILGKLVSAPVSARTGVVSALGSLLSGNLATGVALGGLTSPKLIGNALYLGGKYLPSVSELVGPVATTASDIINPVDFIIPKGQ